MACRMVIGAVVATSLLTSPVLAQSPQQRTYETARVSGQPPVIDGRLADAAWETVAWSDGFTVTRPTEGSTPSQKTAFKILYDDRNLYVGIRLFDAEPTRIERRLSRRDNGIGDDVTISLDSYGDRRTAFVFSVNAAGVKGDAITTNDGAATDNAWDPVWFVATSVDEAGWIAEMRIPLTQLRFSDQENQVWGLQVTRQVFRIDERSDWQFIPGRLGGQTSRFGQLRGLRALRPRRQLEFLPYVVGQLERSPAQEGNPFETGQRSSGLAGLDGKVGLTSNTTLDFTVNPDFGQVEADPAVVNLTAFETFYQEKRPFFVEGARVFDVPISSFGTSAMDRLFYSRRIGRPPQTAPDVGSGEFADIPDRTTILGAAKVTGKTASGWTLGMLDSVTGETSAEIDRAGTRRTQAVEPLTNYFVGRVQKDYRRGQTLIGGLFTMVNRRLDDPRFTWLHSSAYTGGVEVAHYWADRAYYAKSSVVFSSVRGSAESIALTQQSQPRFFARPDAGYLGYDPTRTSLWGNGGSVELGRSGNSRFLVNASYAWRSPGLDINDLGFQRTADYRVGRVQANYNEFQPRWVFRTFNAGGAFWVNYLYSGERAGIGGYVSANGQLRNFWRLFASYETNSEYLDATVLRGGPAMMTSARTNMQANVQSDPRRRLSAALGAAWSRDPNDEENQRTLTLQLMWRPTSALDLSVQPNVMWRDPRLQYVGRGLVSAEPKYVLASLEQRTVGVTFRANFALTPGLTLQYYGQPFVSAGRYYAFKQITDPRAATFDGRFRLLATESQSGRLAFDEDGNGSFDYSLRNPDYGFRQFRSNLVARWEYSPGSTLFVVWSQGRTSSDSNGAFALSTGLRRLFDSPSDNVFLVKISRWLSW